VQNKKQEVKKVKEGVAWLSEFEVEAKNKINNCNYITSVKFSLALIIISFCACRSYKEPGLLKTSIQTIYSEKVEDSLEIYITLPGAFSKDSTYSVVYYTDANIKSGKALRRVINEIAETGKSINAIFVGVGHMGNTMVLRRRDFITPHLTRGDSLYSNEIFYGHPDHFYSFMKDELIPMVEKNYSVSAERTIIGHSFGGLFVFYCLFQPQPLFQNYIALSPSLWVNYGNIYQYETKYRKLSNKLNANLFIRTGSREKLNRVLSSSNKMTSFLQQQPYDRLQLDYKIVKGETHNSHVEKSLKEILTTIKF
jgi:predicted alpha/beta superfamily hydrolase